MNETNDSPPPEPQFRPPAARTFTADEVRHFLAEVVAEQETQLVGIICQHKVDEVTALALFDGLDTGKLRGVPRASGLDLYSKHQADDPKSAIHRAVRAFIGQIRTEQWDLEIRSSGGC